MDLFLRTPPEQLCAAQIVVLSNVHVFVLDLSQTPTHVPEPAHALRGVKVKLQVPVTQDSQFPWHKLSQQCPSTQFPVTHSVPLEQTPAPFGLHVPDAQ